MNFLSCCRWISVRLMCLKSHSCFGQQSFRKTGVSQSWPSYLPSLAAEGPLVNIVEGVFLATIVLALVLFWPPFIVANEFPATADAILKRLHRRQLAKLQ